MSQKWRNKGAPFTTEDRRRVERGDVVSLDPESRDYRMRRYKLRPAPPGAEETARPLPEDPEEEPRGLFPGIDFGSDRAYEIARAASPPLTVEELESVEGSGEDGALLTSDVRALIAAREEEGGEEE